MVKRLMTTFGFLGLFLFTAHALSAQNIYIRGHLRVISIDPISIDIICDPPYDTDCFSIITTLEFETREQETIPQEQEIVSIIGRIF